MGEHKTGTHPAQNVNAFLGVVCSISANLMSALLAFSMRRHTPFVRLLGERTKLVAMGAPLNKYG